MKRMLVAALVLALAVTAQAGVVTTVSSAPVATVTMGTVTIDVYTVTQTATDPNGTVGAIVLGVGNDGGVLCTNTGVDPFQAWTRITSSQWNKTIDQDTIETYQTELWDTDYQWTDANAPIADTRFMPDTFLSYSPVVVSPMENNDGSYYLAAVQSPAQGDALKLRLGRGELYAQVGVPVAYRSHSMLVAKVGVVRDGGEVWAFVESADDLGGVTSEEILIPEPATLSLLGLGALALIRRRR